MQPLTSNVEHHLRGICEAAAIGADRRQAAPKPTGLPSEEAGRSVVMDVYLETARLTLRRFTETDVDNLHALNSDPAVMRFLTGGRPTARSTIEHETLPRFLRGYDRVPGTGRWAAVERSTGEFLGWFALDPPDGGHTGTSGDGGGSVAGGEVELGYRLRAAAWNKGYATEGSLALIRKAFTELGVARVFAHTMAVNAASRRVMEKAGMRLLRHYNLQWTDPVDGAEHGEVEYELRRADWVP